MAGYNEVEGMDSMDFAIAFCSSFGTANPGDEPRGICNEETPAMNTVVLPDQSVSETPADGEKI